MSEKKDFIKKYFIIVGSIMLIFCIFLGLGLFLYTNNAEPAYVEAKQETDWERLGKSNTSKKTSEKNQTSEKEENIDESIFSAPARTNFLLIGQDKIAGLTDTLIAGTFVSATGEISLVSIPRDLYTVLERDKIRDLNDAGRYPPSHFKLNALYNYAGGGDHERGLKYLKDEISEVLGINFDYYAMIDTKGFRAIVDAIGGIDFEVPETASGGLYYNDAGQDLYINLDSGMQHLNGRQAEGLVRFRKGYASQDIKRMEVQRDFLKVFLKTILSKENITKNLKDLISNFMEYVETDFSISDIPKYLSCISKINADNIQSAMLPCEGEMIDGAYYFILQEEEAKEVIDEYLLGIKPETTTETTTENISE